MLSSLGITTTDILEIDTFELEKEDDETIMDKPKDMTFLRDLKPVLSTMTACGNIGGDVDTSKLIEDIKISPYWKLQDGIIRIEGYDKEDPKKWIHRGICRKYLTRKHKGKGPFKNAATFYVRLFDEEKDEYKEPSIKIFHNGGFQITGIRNPSQLTNTMKILIDGIKEINGFLEEGAPFKDKAYQEICMMNADITIGYTLNRSAIQKLITEKHTIRSTYETTAYQGVNIKFFWNAVKHTKSECQDGTCPCETQCVSTGKKTSVINTALRSKSKCTKITIAPFLTGKIIVTGAKNEDQIHDATKWILKFIEENAEETIGSKIKTPKIKSIPNPIRKNYPFVTNVSSDKLVSS